MRQHLLYFLTGCSLTFLALGGWRPANRYQIVAGALDRYDFQNLSDETDKSMKTVFKIDLMRGKTWVLKPSKDENDPALPSQRWVAIQDQK